MPAGVPASAAGVEAARAWCLPTGLAPMQGVELSSEKPTHAGGR